MIYPVKLILMREQKKLPREDKNQVTHELPGE